MVKLNLNDINISDPEKQMLSEYNLLLNDYSAEQRISWSLKNLPATHILSSSFGIQSCVLLHLMTLQKPNLPVVLIDTGYLFPETYHFIDFLRKKLNLNLKVFRPKLSSAWQEARYGKLWEKGIKGIDLYNTLNKVKPMRAAIKKLSVQTWFSGLRREQSKSRSDLPYLSIQKKVFKVFPILDWSSKKIHKYLIDNNLNYHPLWKHGYISVGDIHTTSKLKPGMSEEETRFFGLKRECGLHKN
ncbi:phosphoadenylyl-sulfate reductase [Buchnera aphidicola (Muscaphis stroyani)]|uniref:Phosphoadenosine 5'-phosphosulfate reductase n=1 Tax=Buchnera aphidicola (Muscaphis stroyani) TaxID=1241869 RepID=A0A4D6YF55_9GAMM|nr:phosphoadenylyl-sulfate reductase [Buchnera aphidicola]QCI24474.1 phosphoadenylyl-sulfate reductase [Buchnera aphidicola (Muscaphis stroyani)]